VGSNERVLSKRGPLFRDMLLHQPAKKFGVERVLRNRVGQCENEVVHKRRNVGDNGLVVAKRELKHQLPSRKGNVNNFRAQNKQRRLTLEEA